MSIRRAVCVAGLALGFGLASTGAAELPPSSGLDGVEEQLVRLVPGEGPSLSALVLPPTQKARKSDWPADEQVVGVSIAGERRAYPFALLEAHRVVNDEVGGIPILIWYCDQCRSAQAFDRRTAGGAPVYEVSGTLFRADELLRDRETGSLWSTFLGEAITGPAEGHALSEIPTRTVSLREWRRRFPESRVAAAPPNTTQRYASSPMMTKPALAKAYHPGMPTLGLQLPDGTKRAYPAAEVLQAGGVVEEAGARIAYSTREQRFEVDVPKGWQLFRGPWRDWAMQTPDSEIFRAPEESP